MQVTLKHIKESSLKYLISLFALVLTYFHLFEQSVKVDHIVLFLFGFAIFPWTGQLIASFEFQGIVAKFRGVSEGVDERDIDIKKGKTITMEEIWEEYNQEKK
jgi:hypothetical protein